MMEMIHVYASKGQSQQLLTELKKESVDINSRDSQGYTPLFHAVLDGQMKVVRLLLDNGAALYVEDNRRRTPLHAAISGLSRADTTDSAKVAIYLGVIVLLLKHEMQLREKGGDLYRNIPLLKEAEAGWEDNTPLELCRVLAPQHVKTLKAVIEHYYPEPSMREDFAQLASLLWKNTSSLFARPQSSASQQEQEETESLLKPKSD